MSKYNWKEIQKFYDLEGSYRKIRDKFGASMQTISKAVKRGDLVTRTISEGVKLDRKLNPDKYIQSGEVKKRISKSMIKYLEDNPDKVPYLLNSSNNGPSYPEIYFNGVFKKRNLKYDRYFRLGIYHIDFAFLDRKIAIEVDGEQHYVDIKQIESDIRKNKKLEDNGWDLIRIRWSKYMKLEKEEKDIFITKLINYIENKCRTKPQL